MKWLISLHPKWFFFLSKNLFSRPPRYKITEEDKRVLSQASTEILEVPLIHKKAILKKWEQGKKILMIHGWAGRGIQLRSHIQKFKENGYEVHMIDFPSHGEAPGKTSSVFEFVHTLKVLFSKYSYEAVIAHSVGCAALLGSIDKSLTIPLILFAPHYDLHDSLTKMMRRRGLKGKFVEDVVSLYEKHYGFSFHSFNPKEQAPLYKGPVLIYHDTKDGALPSTHSQSLVKAFSHAKFIETTGLGHNRILRDEKIVEDVFRFIKEGPEALPQN